MTIVSSAKRHSLDVWKYLKDVLDRLLAGETDYTKLLPDMEARESEAIRTYREEESRYKSDRKQLTRAGESSPLNSSDRKPRAKPPCQSYLPVVDAYRRATVVVPFESDRARDTESHRRALALLIMR